MSWKVTQEPEYLPISLVDAKDYLRVQVATDDSLIEECIRAAASYCEEELDLAIMSQEITLKLDYFPSGAIELPRTNLLSVESVSYIDSNGNAQPFTEFTEDNYSMPARVVADDAWPSAKSTINAVTVVYKAGFKIDETGGAENPAPGVVIQAMKLLVTHFYDNRTPVFIGNSSGGEEIAMTVTALLQKFRRLGI